MPINKTENYQLHTWELGDDFLLSEINENFALLDSAARIVAGSYAGNGEESQTIEIGFTPQAVLVVKSNGQMGYSGGTLAVYGGLALQGHNLYADLLEITEGGFTVCNKTGTQFLYLNNGLYYYLAIR